MTESTPSQEIEDVLSSIRRLVADEHPAARRPSSCDDMRGDDAPGDDVPGGEREPLLLTESLRVVPPAAPLAEDSPAGAGGPPPPATDGSDAGPGGRDLRVLFEVAARNVAQIGEPAPMAEWEEEDPDTVGDATPLPFVTRRRARPSPGPGGGPAAGRATERPLPGGDALSAPDAARGGAGDDGIMDDGTTGEEPRDAFVDVGELAGIARSRLREVPVVSVPERDLLRAMVREILLEELSGALGERITRNLRRLARAEANRAVATRDLG